VNTYDPAVRILYVHMVTGIDSEPTPLEGFQAWRLPAGYANRSPRTCLRGDQAQSRKRAAG
jgi:hypothetical protein